jgi:nitrite reductase (NADH) large subunit
MAQTGCRCKSEVSSLSGTKVAASPSGPAAADLSEPLVIIGQGMAATKLVDELALRALGRYAVIIIGAEPRRGYNRVLLSSLLAREVTADEIELKPADWWQKKGVTNLHGRAVVSIDREARRLRFGDGCCLGYSKLVLATGSDPIRLPIPGMNLPGVLTFRCMEDVEAMLASARRGRPVVVIGGGLLGLEAAYGLAKAGCEVTLLTVGPRLMERQIDAVAAQMLQEVMATKGCSVVVEAQTTRVLGSTHVEGVALADGRSFDANLVVCAIGVRPNVKLAREAGLACKHGIVVDDQMRTSDPNVFAIGECVEHRQVCYGLVEPAYEQAKVLSRVLAGEQDAAYAGSVLATNLKVSGVSLFSAGDFIGEDKEVIVFEDRARRIYKKLVVNDDVLAGALLFGEAADGLWYLDLMRERTPLAAMREDLIFGRALATDQAAAVAA